jgi:integrase
MAQLWNAKMPDHLRVFIVLAINTAARPEALLGLRRGQIDIERRLLHLNPPGRTQTKKYRPTLPITDALLPWLSLERDYQVQWKKEQDSPIKSIKTTWRKLRDEAGLDKDVVPYTIRHTVATELRARGVPEWECRGFMGHRSGGVTERYAKFQPNHLGAAVKAIDAYCIELSEKTETPIVLDVVPFTRQLRATQGNRDV